MIYSCRKASTGSSLAAFIDGYKPETNATKKLVTTAAIIAAHGMVKSKSKLPLALK